MDQGSAVMVFLTLLGMAGFAWIMILVAFILASTNQAETESGSKSAKRNRMIQSIKPMASRSEVEPWGFYDANHANVRRVIVNPDCGDDEYEKPIDF